MNLRILTIILLYWSIWILICSIGISDNSNPLYTANYTISGSINGSGFSNSEIDTGFSFMSFIAILTSLGRFFGLALFGLSPVLTGLSQVIFSAWSTAWTLFTIGFIVDSIWSG